MKYIKVISKNGFRVLGFLIVLCVISYLQKSLSWTNLTDDQKSWLNNDFQWLEFEGKQRDALVKQPIAAIDVNLVQRNSSNQVKRKNHSDYKEKIMSYLLSENSDKLSSSIYGKGCRDNPFRHRLKKLLKYWTKLVSPYNIEYFLCYGSLLGYYRNGDVIPYDHDVDMCVNQKDFNRLANLESKRPFHFQNDKPHLIIQRHISNGSAQRRTCNGTWVTKKVDPCSILSPLARVIIGLYNFLDVYFYRVDNRYVENPILNLDRKDIYPVRKCLFMGWESRCPHNATSLLVSTYGVDFAWNPHYICRNGQWVATGKNVTERKLQWAVVTEDMKKRKWLRRLKRRRAGKLAAKVEDIYI